MLGSVSITRHDSQWAGVHFSNHDLKEESKRYSITHSPGIILTWWYLLSRGPCSILSKSSWSRCISDVESPHLPWRRPRPLWILCTPCNSRCNQGKGPIEMENLDPFPCHCWAAIHELFCIKIWRGWGRCFEVSQRKEIMILARVAHFCNRSLRPLVIALVPGQQRSLDKLKAMRDHLSNEVADLINEYGPKMYENFDEVCKSPSP
jgi:hypothetical protein